MPSRHKRFRSKSAKKRPRLPRARRAKSRGSRSATISIRRRDQLAGRWFSRLVALQARLRAPSGCPWDREQSHETLRKFLVEETYEVLDAMESGDAKKFCAELGDLLLQIVFHSIIAEESRRFTVSDVIESVHSKMIRRHPHVFGSVKANNSADVLKNWEQLKAEERRDERAARHKQAATADDSILDGVPRSLPAVLEAFQLTQRASHVGFDWHDLAGVLDKLEEEKRELRQITEACPGNGQSSSAHTEEEVGDLLFVAVNVARFLGVDPEISLKKANRKFKERFTWMEAAAAREGRRFADLPRARMEELWNESKKTHALQVR